MRAAKILVPLRKSDWIELFLPYVEQISQPGMRVVFLVQLGQGGFRELTSQLLAIHTGIRSTCLPEKICEKDAVENKRKSAEQQLHTACQSLRERGVKLEIHYYGDPLQSIVQQYLQSENVQLVMMRPTRLDHGRSSQGRICLSFFETTRCPCASVPSNEISPGGKMMISDGCHFFGA